MLGPLERQDTSLTEANSPVRKNRTETATIETLAAAISAPNEILIKALRAYMARLAAVKGQIAGIPILAKFAPPGNKSVMAIPAEMFSAVWAAIPVALAG